MEEGKLFQLAFLVCLLAYLMSLVFRSNPGMQRGLQIVAIVILAGAITAALVVSLI